MAIQLKTHIVKKGESLDRIARNYGLSSWYEIYHAKCNDNLRRTRSTPDKIVAGDIVVIPPDALYYTKIKLDKLLIIRKEFIEMNQKILNEWDAEYRKTKSNIANIDVIGKVATILVSLGTLVKDGASAMKLSGEALKEANTKLAKTAVKDAYEPIVEAGVEALGVLKENKDDTLAIALGKQAADVYFSWTTPSWWASKIDHLRNGGSLMKNGRLQGTDLEEINKQTVDLIIKQKNQTLENLDKRIEDAQNQLKKAKQLKL